VALPDVDRVCVVIGRTRHKMVQMEIQEAAKQDARLLEVRLDFLKKAPDFKRLLDNKPCPLVATVRRPVDGGKWDGSENARVTLLRQAIVAGFDWVDLETDIADNIRRFKDVKRIISYHNFREVPADLKKIHQRMCAQDADIIKIAVRAQHATDNLRILELLDKPAKPTIAFCMGDLGFPSRILATKFGAPFTYAAFNRERNIAPGMPSFAEIKQIYHVHLIDADTKVYGLIGDPVAHSLSPLVHNVAMRRLGINAVYLPFRVPRSDLPAFLKGFDAIPIQGYSVTIPHKEAVVELSAHLDETVHRTHAANTLLRGGDGFSAYNTDYQGAIDSLTAALPTFAAQAMRDAARRLPETTAVMAGPPPPPPEWARSLAESPHLAPLHSRVILVLGAGGAARAIAHALQREGALLTIANRTAERAQGLAHEVGCRHVEWNARHSVLCDVVINCTSVGMHPNVDETPLHPSFLKPGLIVFDTVYVPEQTLLIKEARDRGCHIVTGSELFVRQAAHQFRLFTGREAPLDLMRKVVKRALSPVVIKDEE
jgi:3-dehydroquinate dehydratase/shikimate dehydrogenase